MKIPSILVAAPLVLGTPVDIERRQQQPKYAQTPSLDQLQDGYFKATAGIMAANVPKMRIAKSVAETSTMKAAGAKKSSIWFGPITLLTEEQLQKAAAKTGGLGIKINANTNTMASTVSGFPSDVTILKAHTELKYEDGSPAQLSNGIENHHVTYSNLDKQPQSPFACNVKAKDSSPSRILSFAPLTGVGGNETSSGLYTTPDGAFPAGYYLGKDDKIMLSAELVNHANTTKDVYAVTEIDYVPGQPAGYLDSGVVMFAMNQCDGWSMPSIRGWPGYNKFTIKGTPATAVMDGYMLLRRGRVHDGGTSITLRVNGRTVCDSQAVYGQAGTGVSNMTQCTDPMKIIRGDQMEVEAYFDLDKHPA
ncbi:hypothetical protein BT63DRAFT_119198 [Microthyrium microscopicum]|uniref:Uncharacterized protein n=1 Tax=Microthyrium microscopicum TaxID=703497 RepID=A0A6A6TX86_9PEZI|nr:hypothetical protein BT63DRAFT_119198 [Microthyrium microscopicum]